MKRGFVPVVCLAVFVILFGGLASLASAARHFSEWGAPVSAESVGSSTEVNTASNDGCPIESPDGRSLYMATNRPGGLGGNDIWVAEREGRDAPWGAPVNLGPPVNSAANDFCPTPISERELLFVSERGGPGNCGGADIYVTHKRHGVWSEPENLGCDVNSAAAEAGPSLFTIAGRDHLFFSSTRAGGFAADAPGATAGDSDIYVSIEIRHGLLGAATLVDGLNSAVDDFRPNVRKDGLELVFDSNRPGTLGGQDIWSASREDVDESWSAPLDLAAVNSAANDTRASISGDGKRLTFGSTRPGGEGMSDVYVSTRDKLRGKDDDE